MRIVALILATLSLLACAGVAFLRVGTNFDQAKFYEKVKGTSADKAAVKEAGKETLNDLKSTQISIPDPKKLEKGGYAMVGTGVLSLLLLVLMFIKRGTYVGAILVIAAAAASYFLNPATGGGEMQGMSAQKAAMVIGAPGALGAILASVAQLTVKGGRSGV